MFVPLLLPLLLFGFCVSNVCGGVGLFLVVFVLFRLSCFFSFVSVFCHICSRSDMLMEILIRV